MNRRRSNTVVAGLIAAILLVGGVRSWQAYQQQQAFDQMGSMMDTSMGAVDGPNPLWYVLGTLLISAVIGGGYLIVRDEVTSTNVPDRPQTESAESTDSGSAESPDGDNRSAGSVNP